MKINSHILKISLPNTVLSLYALYYLFLDFSWMYILYTVLGFYTIAIIGSTIGFHRYLTHQSFSTNKFWHYVLIILGSLAGQGSAIFWTALHLHHHRTSDTEKDFHSPVNGFWSSLILWQFKKFDRVPGFFAPRKLYRDDLIRFLHNNYYKFYWAVSLILALINFEFYLYFFVLGGYFLLAWGDNISNYIFHNPKFGYRNFEIRDNSRNVPMIAYIFCGSGWHNNHHANPGNYKFGIKDSEIDLGSKFIDIIRTD
jgi:stearoyl-CoA desaturase (delta-9 desaturase)